MNEKYDPLLHAFNKPPRDPARIEQVLAAVRAYWYMHPDLRLGQIISNAAIGDPFYLEDDKLLAQLKARIDAEK